MTSGATFYQQKHISGKSSTTLFILFIMILEAVLNFCYCSTAVNYYKRVYIYDAVFQNNTQKNSICKQMLILLEESVILTNIFKFVPPTRAYG